MNLFQVYSSLCIGLMLVAPGLGIMQRKPTPKKPSATDNRQFSLLQGEKDGKPLIAMIVSDLKTYSSKPRFQWHLSLSVPFINPTTDGLPNAKELNSLDAWEDDMEARIATQGNYYYVGHVNWNGSREVLFYVENPEPILSQLKKIRESHLTRSFTFICEKDEGWKRVSAYFQ